MCIDGNLSLINRRSLYQFSTQLSYQRHMSSTKKSMKDHDDVSNEVIFEEDLIPIQKETFGGDAFQIGSTLIP